MTKKLILVKQTHTQKETEHKPISPSSPIRTAHVSVYIIEYSCGVIYSIE